MANKQDRCEGQKRGYRRGTYGTFRCLKRAKGTVTTKVGHSVSHPCCGDEACVRSIEGGYPGDWRPFQA